MAEIVLHAGAPFVVTRELEVVPGNEGGDERRPGCAVGVVGNGDRLLVERAAEERQVGGIVDHRVSRGDLRAGIGERRPGRGQPRRDGDLPHQFVPVLPQAGVDGHAAGGLPVIGQVSRGGGAGTREISAAAEGGFKNRKPRQADQFVAGTLEGRGVVETLRVGARLQLVPAGEMQHSRKVVREELRPAARFVRALEVVSAAALGRDNVESRLLPGRRVRTTLCHAKPNSRRAPLNHVCDSLTAAITGGR